MIYPILYLPQFISTCTHINPTAMRYLLFPLTLCFFLLLSTSCNQPADAPTERPNIVWIVSEDNSKHYLNLFEEGGVEMPTVERLAEHGLIFDHAFSQAPVCSVARSTIISGCYAPRVGAQYHRRTDFAPMPDGLEMFPSYLRKAGYYATNNRKEDYNFIKAEGIWDESSNKASFRNRAEGQPFFHVQNFGTTHEGQLHFSAEDMQNNATNNDPDAITPFPYHPNTPTFRYTYAKYRDLHQKVDTQMGKFLEQLEEDGLMENTFIFYYGDHGGVLPGSKGYAYERGVHVPMVVYVPEKWKHLVPAEIGTRIDGFVQFMDLAPTVLNLAGIDIPKQIDGKAFLGRGVELEELNARQSVVCYADRFDEKYDLVRTLRKGKYKYMRNYQPFNFDGLYNFYRYKMLAYKEWKELYDKGELNEEQAQFFESRPAETLFDIDQDPHEVNNLASDPAYAEIVEELRNELAQTLKERSDLSFFPEPYFLANGLQNPVQFGKENKETIAKLIDIADLSLKSFDEAQTGIETALNSSNPLERYWGLIACSSFGKEALSFEAKAKEIAQSDDDNLVRVRAAEFLGLTGAADPEEVMLAALETAPTATDANLILNSIALLKDTPPHYNFAIQRSMVDSTWLTPVNALVYRRYEYLEK